MITLMRRFRKSLQIGLLVIIAAFVASLFVFGATGSRYGGRIYFERQLRATDGIFNAIQYVDNALDLIHRSRQFGRPLPQQCGIL